MLTHRAGGYDVFQICAPIVRFLEVMMLSDAMHRPDAFFFAGFPDG